MLGWQSLLGDHFQVLGIALWELVDVESGFIEIGFCVREK